VLHLSVHSFTPKLNGEVRNADVGILYDPRRLAEREVCTRWKGTLLALTATSHDNGYKLQSDCRIRMNYPYRGASDGLTTALRRVFPARDYLGIELEVNQALLADRGAARRAAAMVARSLEAAI
jgi:predicted N-formylglutamate amidohydrolase